MPFPPPYAYREHPAEPRPAGPYRAELAGFTQAESRDLSELSTVLSHVDDRGTALQIVRYDGGTEGIDAESARMLARDPQSYVLVLRSDQCRLVAGGYAGAVHGLERLGQLSAADGVGCTIVDAPALAVRGMNRDDAEDWSVEYWHRTIDFARTHLLNFIGFGAEDAFMRYASGDTAGYQQRIRCFRELHERARLSAVRLVPMMYNADHFSAQFLKAAGRADLTRRRGRTIIRYDSEEAWDAATELIVQVFADLRPDSFCVWASEVTHERHGDHTLPEDTQWRLEAEFFKRLLARVRQSQPDTTMVVCMAQGARDHVRVFTEILGDLPVEFVHYDGDWTYHISPPALTTYAVRRAVGSGTTWLAKPAWSRVVFQGLPIIRPAGVHAEINEIIHGGLRGVFANASRWQAAPWNTMIGAAAAWSGDRLGLEQAYTSVLTTEEKTRFGAGDMEQLASLWRRLLLFNAPLEGAPRISSWRTVVYHLLGIVHDAARNSEFQPGTFDELYVNELWNHNAAWFQESIELLSSWRRRLPGSADGDGLWATTLRVLPALASFYANALAAGYIVVREATGDNTKGPWRAWRRLLAWHLQRVVRSIDDLLEFTPLDGIKDRDCPEMFELTTDHPGMARAEWTKVMLRVRDECTATLGIVEDPDSFPALQAANGDAGYWPRDGLFSVLGWPVQFDAEISASDDS